MKYSDEQRKYHLAVIRKIIVTIEQAGEYPSIDRIQAIIEANRKENPAFPKIATRNYISALKNKIINDRKHRLEHATVNKTLAIIEDEFNENIAIISNIMRDKTQTAKARVDAARTIAQMRHVLMQMKFDAGVFNRQLGTLVAETTADRIIKETIGYDRGKLSKTADAPRFVPVGSPQRPALPVPKTD